MHGNSTRWFKILVRRNKREIEHGPVLVSEQLDGRSVKRWKTGEKVSILFETELSRKTPVLFGAIQGHSGKVYSGNARINPALQDNVLLTKDFTEYVHHVGNGKEFRSIVRNGLVPGGFSTETGRHAVFSTVVNPLRKPLRIIKSKNRALQKNLETTSEYCILVQFIALSRRRIAILPNKISCGRPL